MSELINVDLALQRILDKIQQLPGETVVFTDALGRILAENITADINLPPFPNSSMDGYAVRAADVMGANPERPVCLKVVMDIPAGSAPDRSLAAGEAARIMTGAPLPTGADAVIPVENTDAQWQETTSETAVGILQGSRPGGNVRPIGEDIQAGQVVLRAGTLIRPAEIGVLAALGRIHISVIRQPRAVVMGTGDELVGVDQTLTAGKIRDTNSYTLAALITSYGMQAIRMPTVHDRLDEVRRLFRQALEQKPDMIVSSAGVSVGTADLVRTVLDELGEVNLWRINIRPGKPLAFGHLQGIPFFGLPGNPVSAMVTFDVFVRPALLKMAGKPDNASTATTVIAEDLRSDGRRSYLRVTLERQNDRLIARTTGTQSSGALMSMVLADGLLIVPEGVTSVKAGTGLQVRLLR